MRGILPNPATAYRRLWDEDTFSSISIMGIRIWMLVAKFVLSIFMARYMGLADLGIYGLIVGASGTVQTVLRGGIFTLLSRDAVHQPLTAVTQHLRHYGVGIVVLYALLIPIVLAAGWYFNAPVMAMLILAVFFTEHLSFDAFVLVSNLQLPKLANLIYSLQSASWIYMFVGFAFFIPSLRTLETLLAFWISGGVAAIAIVLWLSRGWPWRKAFAKKLKWQWYPGKIRRSFKLYLTDVIGVANYYMDRYIVTLFLSLEMTGIYVFFAQVVSATWNLINSGVLVIYRPRLIKAYDREDLSPFNAIFKSCLKRTFLSTVVLSAITGTAVPVLVTITQNEALLNYTPLLWMMLGALMFKIGETAAGTGLYAMHKDKNTFIMGLIGFFLTATAGSVGVAFFGVYGMVFNTIVVSIVSIAYAHAVWDAGTAGAQSTKENDYAKISFQKN